MGMVWYKSALQTALAISELPPAGLVTIPARYVFDRDYKQSGVASRRLTANAAILFTGSCILSILSS